MAVICGIDPGNVGALCFVDSDTEQIISLQDMPTYSRTLSTKNKKTGKAKERTEMDLPKILELIEGAFRTSERMEVFIEHVSGGSMDKGRAFGAVAMFNFGYGAGAVEGIIMALRIPYTKVHPATWKAAVISGVKDKSASVQRACQLFPDHAHLFYGSKGGEKDGRAEAALIAWYGLRSRGLKTKAEPKKVLIRWK